MASAGASDQASVFEVQSQTSLRSFSWRSRDPAADRSIPQSPRDNSRLAIDTALAILAGKQSDLSKEYYIPSEPVTSENPHKTATVWLAFVDSGPENGAMQVVPGTHRSGRFKHKNSVGDSNVLDMELEEDSFKMADAVHLELKAGQFSMHNDYITHGSGPNTSDRLRCGLTIRYPAGEVKCDASIWPFFKSYWMRGPDRWNHNPAGTRPPAR